MFVGILQLTQSVVGTEGSDIITGSDASEVIAGGLGKDLIIGGAGADGFLFERPGEFGKKIVTPLLTSIQAKATKS